MNADGTIRNRLAQALDAKTLVRVSRSPRNSDRIDGFVLAVGPKWVLIAQTGDGGFFDGVIAVRLKDVVKIYDDTSFEARFARTQPEWPPRPPADIDLANTSGLIKSLSEASPLIGIEQERRVSGAKWIGVAEDITDGWLWLREVAPDATWHDEAQGYKLKRITTVSIAGRYLTALAAIAGSSPKS